MATDDNREAHRLILHLQPAYCRASCIGGTDPGAHEATCVEATEWLDAHPVVPPFDLPPGSPRSQKKPHAGAS